MELDTQLIFMNKQGIRWSIRETNFNFKIVMKKLCNSDKNKWVNITF